MIEALRRTGVRFAVLGVAAYLVFLVVTLPASLLDYALERASGGAIALGDARGTVWKGQGALAARSGSGYQRITDIEWRCNPLSIFTGRLAINFSGSAPGATLRANVGLGLRSVRLQNLDVSGPVSVIEPAIPVAAIAKPEGRVRVTADSLEVGPKSVLGAATAEWSEAGMSGVTRIGDYRVQVTGNGDRAAIRLSTARGDLRLNGSGEWSAAKPREIQISGIAEASPDRKDLEPLLQLLVGGGSGNSRQFGWMLTI